jgi:hypothetical protein
VEGTYRCSQTLRVRADGVKGHSHLVQAKTEYAKAAKSGMRIFLDIALVPDLHRVAREVAHSTLSFSNPWSTHHARSVHLVLRSCHERYVTDLPLLARRPRQRFSRTGIASFVLSRSISLAKIALSKPTSCLSNWNQVSLYLKFTNFTDSYRNSSSMLIRCWILFSGTSTNVIPWSRLKLSSVNPAEPL